MCVWWEEGREEATVLADSELTKVKVPDSHLLFPKTQIKGWPQASGESVLQVSQACPGEQKGLENVLMFEKKL